MTEYKAVAVYDLDGVFKGYGILGSHKLQSTNIWLEGEEDSLNHRILELNASVDIKKHWPHPQDPEVLTLLNDVNFMPIQYTKAEVIDEDQSYIVFKQEDETNEFGTPTGRTIDGTEYDQEASVIVMKEISVPSNPTDSVARIKAACEQVARQRSKLVI